MKRFVEGEDRTQNTLFPERLDDYICEDNPVRVCGSRIDRQGGRREGERRSSRSWGSYKAHYVLHSNRLSVCLPSSDGIGTLLPKTAQVFALFPPSPHPGGMRALSNRATGARAHSHRTAREGDAVGQRA
jgi:hypothetical protein